MEVFGLGNEDPAVVAGVEGVNVRDNSDTVWHAKAIEAHLQKPESHVSSIDVDGVMGPRTLEVLTRVLAETRKPFN